MVFVLGTRPEVIKLAPLVCRALDAGDDVTVLVTSQHDPALLVGMLRWFGVPDDCVRVRPVTSRGGAISGLGELQNFVTSELADLERGWLIVQGDTMSTFTGALAGFLAGWRVAHVEAGLRTHDLSGPFPEEALRQMISRIATLHFCPTDGAAKNLISEGVDPMRIYVVGNTGLDALRLATAAVQPEPVGGEVLVTLHRRESWNGDLHAALGEIRQLARMRPDLGFTVAMHPNPFIQEAMIGSLSGELNVALRQPLDFPEMVEKLLTCVLLITDSGGLQEEALALDIPTAIVRDKTERPEVLELGNEFLVGGDGRDLLKLAERLLAYSGPNHRAFRETVLGDGNASARIRDVVGERQAVGV